MSTKRKGPSAGKLALQGGSAGAERYVDVGDEKLFRVGEIARQTGKTTRAIRFYEEIGLVIPAGRTKGGFRQYDRSALVRIYWIDRLQQLGFSLPEIGEFLSALQEQERGPAAMHELRAFYSRKLIETRKTIKLMQALESELQESLTYLSGCRDCAPATPREACRGCAEEAHREHPQPALVAGVHSHG